ncbi:MucR family transcriptional regulator [Sphingomonas sp. H39-1-10]|uniref:MucR family transcriptional regulator n=1 Tax=Sphingomonas pollutisoli TaxID=3030829 RepID=UPI0023BA1084|nr:MucR family transcriptional regulator [Sphingomonas pollutisoli]MDF0490586.1 MucR family transcriptional regulator [Sphingomonas pollutisoli]
MTDSADKSSRLITLTADIVSAHVANNSISVSDLPTLIGNVHAALAGLGTVPVLAEAPAQPAVAIRSSVKPDYIVCLEDGKKLKMLKRHLMTHYQMTPADYRAKWHLPADYPMVAPNYAETRRALAHKIGLGRKAVLKPVAAPPVEGNAAPKRRGPRKKLSISPVTE